MQYKQSAIDVGKTKCSICNKDIASFLLYFNRAIEDNEEYFYEMTVPIQFPTCPECSELLDKDEIIEFNKKSVELLSELIDRMRARLLLPK